MLDPVGLHDERLLTPKDGKTVRWPRLSKRQALALQDAGSGEKRPTHNIYYIATRNRRGSVTSDRTLTTPECEVGAGGVVSVSAGIVRRQSGRRGAERTVLIFFFFFFFC